jgi:hypothetical protein
MKSTYLVLTTLFISATLFSGCSSSGADTASLNAKRGAPSAHVSSAQAQQYARQQRLEANEVRLENMKRRQATDAVNETSRAVNNASSAARSIDSLRSLF